MRFDLPAIVRHPLSVLGAGLTTVTAGLFLVLLLLDTQHYGFLIAQIFFGLWLVPLGYPLA